MSRTDRSRALVSRAMVFPSVRWTRRRRNGIGRCRIALAGEAHLTVLEHGETIALRARHGALANDVEAHVGLGSGDEDRALVSDRGPPAIVAIALIKDIARPRLDRDRAPDLGVVDVGISDVEDA